MKKEFDEATPEVRLLTSEEKEKYAAETMRLAHSVAHGFSNYRDHLEHDDLFSAALEGLAKALNTYQTGGPAKFSTYAQKCMKNEVLYFLRGETKHIQNNISDETVIYSDSSGNDFKLSDTISLNTQGPDTALGKDLMLSQDLSFLRESLKTLSPFDYEIIDRRFGLSGEPQTQDAIAEAMGMSQANVSKVIKSIQDKLHTRMKGKVFIEDGDYYQK